MAKHGQPKISAQSDWQFQIYGQICGKNHKKERERKSPQNDHKNQGQLAIAQKLLVQ